MIKSNGFAAVMFAALLTTLAAADDGARKLTSGERIVIAESAAWGVVNTLHDGSLGLVIQRARTLQNIDGANVAMEWLRSTDGGRTWSDPVLIHELRGPGGETLPETTRRRLYYIPGEESGVRSIAKRTDRLFLLPVRLPFRSRPQIGAAAGSCLESRKPRHRLSVVGRLGKNVVQTAEDEHQSVRGQVAPSQSPLEDRDAFRRYGADNGLWH